MINDKILLKKFNEFIEDEYFQDENQHKYIWTSTYNNEIKFGIYLTGFESIKDNALTLYGMYWSRFGQITVKIGNAIAGWNRRFDSSGLPISLEIYTENYKSYILLYFNVYHNGITSTTIFKIDSDGEITYYSRPIYDNCSKTFANAVKAMSEYLKVRLGQLIEDNLQEMEE